MVTAEKVEQPAEEENRYDSVMERIRCWHLPGRVPTTEEAIREFEREVSYELPADYRQFLMKYGYSAGDGDVVCPVLGEPEDCVAGVGVFYGLNPGESRDLRAVREVFLNRPFGRHLPKELLAVASSPGGEICISLAGDDVGSVYWWGHSAPTNDPDDNIELLAPDFDSFMKSLRLESE